MNRYILIALVLCLLVGSVQAWGASMNSWDYRKEITINNTGANLTNYQVLFTVNRSAGSDSGFTTYLNGKCESDYDDIRFTTSDENTLCDYWIESSSSTVATIWVEVPSIVNSTAYGSTTMYLYYGNVAASAVSDGDATFLFFDHFDSGSLDLAKWDIIVGSPTIASSICQVETTSLSGEEIRTDNTFAQNTSLRTRLKYNGAGVTNFYSVYGYANAAASKYTEFQLVSPSGKLLRNNDGSGTVDTSVNPSTPTDYHIYDIHRTSSLSSMLQDGSSLGTNPSKITADALNLWFFAIPPTGTSGYIYIDWVLVRKYAATEPTISTWGSEEEQFPKYLTVDFSGVPTSGYVPLTVYFTDASIGYNVTLNTWAWSFGDSSANSTQQNPAHTYTTSGLYNVILTVTNTSFSKTNTTQKTAYINVTVNPDAPNADFTVTETCGETSDTFYFIDFSTGGGLYAWNWSFGDGAYSELRNPTHQYSSNGTYDVGLTVWGAYGNDTLTRSNLITIPCGAATPTPTVTVTPTGTGNATTPVQGPAQPGRISPLGFVLLATIDFGLFFYALVDNENRNYFHIIACIAAVIVSFLCGTFLITGYITEDFVVTNIEASVNESVISTYSVHQAQIIDAGFGYFFMFIGVVMLIIGVLASIEAFREFSSGAGGDFE